jgi:methylmalonyl-CoA/ethylmalonyl-CoA epimerase
MSSSWCMWCQLHPSEWKTFIEKRGEGLHHLAFEVDDIKSSLTEKSQEGFQLIHQEPKDGADNKQIAFLHPQSTGGVLTEFCQDKDKIAVD